MPDNASSRTIPELTTASEKEATILFVSGVKGDTRRYRSFHPYEQMRLLGIPCELAHIIDANLTKKIQGVTVAIFHRVTWDQHVEFLFNKLRSQGALVLFDTDDLIFDTEAVNWIDSPDFQDPIRFAIYKEDLKRNLLTLKSCDAVLTSCDYLAGQVRKLGKPAWVHRNAFSLEMLAVSVEAYRSRQLFPEKLVIGYASGTPTHNRDFALITPVLLALMKKYPQIELQVIGPVQLNRDWEPVKNRIRQLRLVPWRSLPGLLAQFDINLAPLVTSNPFSQSKSEIKYMEAALLRVPTIASPTDSFFFAIESGKNGYLAVDEAAWDTCLEQLVLDSELRRAMGECAYQNVIKSYHPSVRAKDLVAAINEISSHVGKDVVWSQNEFDRLNEESAGSLDPNLEFKPTTIQRGLYNLRYRGFKTLSGQVWFYFRRKMEPIFPYRQVEK